MHKTFIFLIISLAIFNLQLTSQSLVLEGGLSKHFIPKAIEYEQPNLHMRLQHRITEKFEYHLNYYSISTYWPFTAHLIIPWQGDEKEIYTRKVTGLDLNLNVLSLIYPETNFGFSVGPTFRKRYETGFELCQFTTDGWMECFGYNETYHDLGLNFEVHYNYFIWEKLGLGVGFIERIYDSGPSSFSINGGVVYKFNFDKKKGD